MNKVVILIFLCIFFAFIKVNAQQSVGIGTNTPNPRSVLELVSLGQNQGFLLPRLNTTEIASIAVVPSDRGLMVFDNLTNEVKYWNGSIWLSLSNSGSIITNLNGLTNGTQTFATGTSGTNFNINSVGSTHTFNFPNASAANRGLLTSADWTTFNNKQSALTIGNVTTSTTGLSITGGAGSVIGSGTTINIQNANGTQPGLLTAADWTTFNNKQGALTIGNVTTSTAGLSVTGGTGSVIGAGTTINIQNANGTQPGLLTAVDWTTFNNKQNAFTPANLLIRGNSSGTSLVASQLYDDGTNVGIGTSSPAYKVQVAGSLGATGVAPLPIENNAGTGTSNVCNPQTAGQGFTATQIRNIVSIEVELSGGISAGTVTIDLYNGLTNSGIPAYSQIINIPVDPGPGFYTFPLTTPFPVVNGNTYAFKITPSGCFSFFNSVSNPYAGGDRFFNSTVNTGWDMDFRVNYQPSGVIINNAGNGEINFSGTLLPNGNAGTAGQVLTSAGPSNAPTWTAVGGSGTVTSVGTGTGLTGGPITTTGTISLANSGVTAGSYGTASAVGTFTVDATGRLTSASNQAIAINASQVTAGTFGITQGGTNGTATPTAGAVAYGTGTAYAFTAAGTTGQQLQSNGAGVPTWVNPPGAGWLLTGNAGTNPLTNYLGTSDAQPLRINTNGTERMRVSATGVVGINNANPVAGSFNPAMRLDVSGAIRTARDGVNGEEGGEFALGEPGLAPGGGTGNWIMDAYFAGGVNKVRLFNTRTGNNHLNITDNGTPFVGIGNFGFAEAALATLDVKGNVRIVDGTQAAGRVLTSDAGGYATWQTLPAVNSWSLLGNAGTVAGTNYIGTSDNVALRFRTNNIERFAITNTGNVGVGTIAPASRFVVSQTVSDAGIFKVENTGNTNGDRWWIGFNHGGGSGDANDRARIGVEAAFSGAGRIYFTNGTAGSQVERMRIDENGNIGIGTSFPARRLHVQQTGSSGGLVLEAPSNSAALLDLLTLGNGTAPVNNAATRGWQWIAYGNTFGTLALQNDMALFNYNGTGGNNVMHFDAAGNVGLGTTAPLERLHVGANIFLQNDLNLAENNDHIIKVANRTTPSANGANLVINASNAGSGGLGVSGGSITLQAGDAWNNGGAGSGGAVNIISGGNFNTSDNPGFITMSTRTGTVTTERMRILASGNVGIGTTAPTAQLHTTGGVRFQAFTGPGVLTVDASGNVSSVSGGTVVGSGQINRVAYWNTASTLSSSTQFYWDNANEFLGVGWSAPERPLHLHRASGADVFSKYTNTNTFVGAGNGFEVGILAAGDAIFRNMEPTSMQFHTSNIERMRISNTGNVGIGTTAPNARLSIGLLGGTAASTTFSTNAGVLGTGALNELSLASIGFNSGNQSSFSIRALRQSAGTDWTTTAIVLGMDVDNTIRAGGSLLAISNNGNIGIGTTSPNAPLQFSNALANRKVVLWEGANNDHQYFGFGINSNTLRYQVANTADDHVFFAGSSATTSNEIMRVKGNGYVGIGTASPSAILDIQGTASAPQTLLNMSSANTWGTAINIGNSSSSTAYQLVTAGSAHPTLASGSFALSSLTSGNLITVDGSSGDMAIGALSVTTNKIGIGVNPTGSSKVYVRNSDNSFSDGMWLQQNRSSAGTVWGLYNTTSNSSTGTLYGIYSLVSGGTAANRWSFYGNDKAFITAGTWGTSDQNLKENISEIKNAISIVQQIPSYMYSYKKDDLYKSFNFPEGIQYGFMAQDLEKVLPTYVNDSEHFVPEDLEKKRKGLISEPRSVRIKSVNYQGIIPILTQAIKEQQEQIELLKQQVEELLKKP